MDSFFREKLIGFGAAVTFGTAVGTVLTYTEPYDTAAWSFQQAAGRPDGIVAEVEFSHPASQKLARIATESVLVKSQADIESQEGIRFPNTVENALCTVRSTLGNATSFVLDCTLVFKPFSA